MEMLNKEELLNIKGGAITATLINAISRSAEFVLEIGRIIGNYIKCVTAKKSSTSE